MSFVTIKVLLAWCFLAVLEYGTVEAARRSSYRRSGGGSSYSVSDGELGVGEIIGIVIGGIIGFFVLLYILFSIIQGCRKCCRKHDCCHICNDDSNRIDAESAPSEVDAEYLEAAEYYLRLRALASAMNIDPDSEPTKKQDANATETSSESSISTIST